MKFRNWQLLLIPFAAFIAIIPLLRYGCSCGHDFDFHLLNWIEVAEHWRVGIFYPHWMHWSAWLAGEPRFTFYPPLSWLFGGALMAIAGLYPPLYPAVAITFTFLVITGAGFAAYSLARKYTTQTPAILCAVLYAVNPYMLFTAYERTAYAELLAAVWLPLLLRALLAENSEDISVTAIAIPLALLWLTNAPAAVMGCYTLALIAIVRVVQICINSHRADASLRPLLPFCKKIIGSLALALALAAFYILPAAYERRWVQIESVVAGVMSPFSNFLFEHSTDAGHDAVLRTASWVAVISLAICAIFLVIAFLKNKDRRPTIPAIVAAAIFIGLLPISLPFWKYLPQLIYLQFPWRFIAVLGCITVIAMALALPALRRRWLLIAIAIPLILIPIGYHFFVQSCELDDEAALETHGSGTTFAPTDEYTPRNADPDLLQQYDQPFWLAASTDAPPSSVPANAIATLHADTEHYRYTAILNHSTLLVLRVWEYPAWHVTVNGRDITNRPKRNDGLMVIPLSEGTSKIDIHYERTWDNTFGDLISLIAFVILLLLLRRQRTRTSSVTCLSSTAA